LCRKLFCTSHASIEITKRTCFWDGIVTTHSHFVHLLVKFGCMPVGFASQPKPIVNHLVRKRIENEIFRLLFFAEIRSHFNHGRFFAKKLPSTRNKPSRARTKS